LIKFLIARWISSAGTEILGTPKRRWSMHASSPARRGALDDLGEGSPADP